jgi:hypothetical protein
MPSNVIPAIPASQLANVVPSVLVAGGSPLQFWGMLVDSNLGMNGYPLSPMGQVLLFSNAQDVSGFFGSTSQEAGLGSVYFGGPIGATKVPSGLLVVQYALNSVPGYLRGGKVSGLSLGQLQAINAPLTVSIDGAAAITATINLAAATSFSNAAEIIGATLGTRGIQKGSFQASLSGNVMTVSPFATASANGALHATFTASLSGASMIVSAVAGGYLQVGDVVVGTGITPGTTISSYSGGGQPGGIGTYVLSQAATTETAETVSCYAPVPVIQLGDVVIATGIPTNTYIASQSSGTTGGAGTYVLSQSVATEAAETINQYAPGCAYSSIHGSFNIHSSTLGPNSSVSYCSGPAATSLFLTAATGAVQSPGSGPSDPTTLMNSVIAQTQNWVSFMTTWEPTDYDKATYQPSSFAWWCNAQNNGYRYCMWETNVVDTQVGGPSAAVAQINNAALSGTVMIYTNPAITTLPGEKAAFEMSWAACLDFIRRGGRQTAAFKAYSGALPDVTNGSIAQILAGAPQIGTFGFGINFYGDYTTRSQGFPEYQRGLISGPFVWDDTYCDQVWLNASLQNAIMIGLTSSPSVPYANPGYATIEAWCLDPILAAVNYGAIVAGVALSNAQATAVNTAAGVEIAQTLTQRGWYLQVQPAVAATRAIRASPPCTLWWCDGGSIQAINLASITIQ